MKNNQGQPLHFNVPVLGEVTIKITLDLKTGASHMQANRPDVAWLQVANCLAAQQDVMFTKALEQVKDENQQVLAVLKFLAQQIGAITAATLAATDKNTGLNSGVNGGLNDGSQTAS